jgi:hypothetical protein
MQEARLAQASKSPPQGAPEASHSPIAWMISCRVISPAPCERRSRGRDAANQAFPLQAWRDGTGSPSIRRRWTGESGTLTGVAFSIMA